MKKILRTLNDSQAEVFDAIKDLPFYNEHLSTVFKYLDPNKAGIYADLGCGTGNFLAIAKTKKIRFIGVDFSSKMLEKAKEKSKNLLMADLHNLPFRNESIDGAVCINVVYQLTSPDKFFEEVLRILKPKGRIVISTPRKGKSAFSFIPALIRAIVKQPRLLTKLGKIFRYNLINKKIIDVNPTGFYDTEELKLMLKPLKVKRIKRIYNNQNWLIIAEKS